MTPALTLEVTGDVDEVGSSWLAARCRVVDPTDPGGRALATAYARHVASIPPYPDGVVVKLLRRL